jgi:hypothetical protein
MPGIVVPVLPEDLLRIWTADRQAVAAEVLAAAVLALDRLLTCCRERQLDLSLDLHGALWIARLWMQNCEDACTTRGATPWEALLALAERLEGT